MTRARARAAFLLILCLGAYWRLSHNLWDEGTHIHPDERFISMVEDKLAQPSRLLDYFDSAHSPLNPYNRGDTSFVYGTLPVFASRAVGRLVHSTGYDGTFRVGRALSGVFDLFTIWLVYLIARRFSRRETALVAAGLFAFCPLAIQLSHFWAVDTFLTAFTAAALMGCVRHALGRSGWLGDIATGIAIGLAVACKITALALLGPAGLAVLARELHAGLPSGRSEILRAFGRASGRLAAICAAALVGVRVGLPYAFLGPSPFSLRLDPRWLADIKRLSAGASSFASFPPAFQWADRGVLFPFKNFVLWGASPVFGLAALLAIPWAVVAIWRRRTWAFLPILSHEIFLIAYHGLGLVKAMRYWYPAYPGLAVTAALALRALARRFETAPGPAARLARAAPAITLVATLLGGFAFSRIYTRPVTRVAASDWIYQHVPPARVAGESWDDGLPMPRPGGGNSESYRGPVLPLFDPDSTLKADTLLSALAEADWIAVTSNRVWGNITRIPDVFPMSIAYYRALFEGRLGFERAADFTSYPNLGPIRFPDDTAEEQFTVYDHPRVLLFRKTKEFSLARARQILLAPLSKTPPTLGEWERWPRSHRRVTAPVLPGRNRAAEKLPGATEVETPLPSVAACLLFYIAILAVGLCALPLVASFLPRLTDRGAGVAPIAGLAGATYLLVFTVQMRLWHNGRGSALACLLVLAAAGALAFLRRRQAFLAFWREQKEFLFKGQIAFAAGFFLFVAVRAANPEIYWGEKPMDFSILNILVRTRGLPPSDPWFAGAPLGYYSFGQEMIAFLSLVTGLSTRYTFNLAFGWIGGAAFAAAYSLLRNWTGTRRGGLAGLGFTALLGNLAGLREWLINQPAAKQPRHLDWHYFWATSRVIPNTINEYPLWSLLFADLHAHVLAIPLFLFLATCGLNLVRAHAAENASWRERLVAAALLGFAAAVQVLTNAWDAPVLAGLLVLIALAAGFPPRRTSPASVMRGFLSGFVAIVCAIALVMPLWVRGGGVPGHGKNGELPARGVDVLTVFGLFFFLAVVWWIASSRRRLLNSGWSRTAAAIALAVVGSALAVAAVLAPSAFCLAGIFLFGVAAVFSRGEAEDRLAFGFVAAAFGLIFFTQHFYIYDRMNTFFKLYLESWLLLAVATAALVFRPAGRPGSFSQWGRTAKTAFAVLVAAALFTSVTAARGAVDARLGRPAPSDSRGDSNERIRFGGPTLDGLHYLESVRPGEYRAVAWMRRALKGTPVLLEAQGPSYQDFGRISMFTGLPTVLGWEYHVQQRGNPESEIKTRKEAVAAMYSNPDSGAIETLLRRYHVGYVYVGWLERQTYPPKGLVKFALDKHLFQVVYENPQAQIYRVVGGDSEDVVAPMYEKVVAAPEPGAPAPDTEPEEPPLFLSKASPDVSPFGNMREPRGAAVDDRGRLWIADFGNSRLRIFAPDGGYLGGWGGRGGGTFGLRELCGVAIRGPDLYVADTWNGRVQHFTLSGEWKESATGLYGPRGIAVAPDGSVWVTDTGNNRVVHYDSTLQTLGTFGKKGSGPDDLAGPVGIAAGASGTVSIADTGNRRIQVLDASGKRVREIPFPGWKENAVEPNLAADSDENLYATDPGKNEVIAFDREGTLRKRWTADSDGKPFVRPTGVAIDAKNAILYVVNSGSNSVSRIRLSERKTP